MNYEKVKQIVEEELREDQDRMLVRITEEKNANIRYRNIQGAILGSEYVIT